MNYKLSRESGIDLENIWIYTVENWSHDQANRYLELIFDEIDYLTRNPESGLDCGHIRKGYFRSKVKSHLIFYRVNRKQNQLEIIRILHQVMDLENHLK